MEPIASRVFLAVAAICGQIVPCSADDTVSAGRLQDHPVPSFIPPSGRVTFKTAVADNSASAIAARRAAEALGAKFSDINTSSLPPSPPVAAPQTIRSTTPASELQLPTAEADPPHIVEPKEEARSIVLSSRHTEDAKPAKRPTKSELRSKRSNMRRSPSGASRGAAIPSGGPAKETTLAAIGQKVSFVELLTNPALWHWPTLASSAPNDSYANR